MYSICSVSPQWLSARFAATAAPVLAAAAATAKNWPQACREQWPAIALYFKKVDVLVGIVMLSHPDYLIEVDAAVVVDGCR